MKKVALAIGVVQIAFTSAVFGEGAPVPVRGPVLDKVVMALPKAKQEVADKIMASLAPISDDTLSALSLMSNPCTSGLGLVCSPELTEDEVKPFLKAEAQRRMQAGAKRQHDQNFVIASGGLAVSVCSLALSILAFRKNRQI